MIFQWVLQRIASSKIKLFRLYFPISMLDIIIGNGYCIFAQVCSVGTEDGETREDVIVWEMLICWYLCWCWRTTLPCNTHIDLLPSHNIHLCQVFWYFIFKLLVKFFAFHTGQISHWKWKILKWPLLSFYFMRLDWWWCKICLRFSKSFTFMTTKQQLLNKITALRIDTCSIKHFC